jgi:hypothetical protein
MEMPSFEGHAIEYFPEGCVVFLPEHYMSAVNFATAAARKWQKNLPDGTVAPLIPH